MKKFFSIFAAALVSLSMSASVVFTATDFHNQGVSGGNATDGTAIITATRDGVTLSEFNGYGNPQYDNTQFFANSGKITIAAPTHSITGVRFIVSSVDYNGFQKSGVMTPSVGTIAADASGMVVTWTGSAADTLKIEHNKQMRVVSTTIYLDGEEMGDGPVITVDTLTIAEAMTQGEALEAGGKTGTVVIAGYIVKAYQFGEKYEDAQSGYIADQPDVKGDFYLFNCKVAAPGFAEGDYVAVSGQIQKYVSTDGTKTTIEITGGNVTILEHATAVENIESAAKATKVIENGQMVIIRNGVRFNAAGARL